MCMPVSRFFLSGLLYFVLQFHFIQGPEIAKLFLTPNDESLFMRVPRWSGLLTLLALLAEELQGSTKLYT